MINRLILSSLILAGLVVGCSDPLGVIDTDSDGTSGSLPAVRGYEFISIGRNLDKSGADNLYANNQGVYDKRYIVKRNVRCTDYQFSSSDRVESGMYIKGNGDEICHEHNYNRGSYSVVVADKYY